MTNTEKTCQISRCTNVATVLWSLDRPAETATRSRDFRCSVGHFEAPICSEHAAEKITHVEAYADWRFFGDVVTFRPLADS